jgi:hypothetical protein
MLTQPRKASSSSGGSSSMGGGMGATANGLLKVPSGFGQGDMRRRGHR